MALDNRQTRSSRKGRKTPATARGQFTSRTAPQGQWAQVLERRRRRVRIGIRIVGVVLGLILLAAIGMGGYITYLDWKIGRGLGSGLAGVLTDRVPDEPFYMVIMGKDARPGESKSRSDTLILARIDAKSKRVTLVSIPRDTRVEIPGYKTTKINAAAAKGGPALVVETVSKFAGVPVSHYVEVDFAGFRELVDALGGVDVDVPVQIKDRNVGSGVILAGPQRLNGDQALMLVRSRAFPTGDLQRIANQQVFLRALAAGVLSVRDPLKLRSVLSAGAETVTSDMSVAEMVDLGLALRGMDTANLETVSVPGEPDYIGGAAYVIHDEVAFAAMMARIDAGESAIAVESPAAIDPADVRVVVHNGAGVDGVASSAAARLTEAGFKVTGTGNAPAFGYDTTLVVYSGTSTAMAKAVLEQLGKGKLAPVAGQYAFDGDVLVIVGRDWASGVGTP